MDERAGPRCSPGCGRGGATRSKVVGVWETGEGEQVPPPRRPLPQGRYSHGPVHGDRREKNRIRLPTGYTPDTAAPLISPRTATAPAAGAGEERRRRGRGGGGGRSIWVACWRRRRRGGGGRREVRWLECGRQGRGNKFPLPVSLSPRGDIHTVHSMGRSWRRTRHGDPLNNRPGTTSDRSGWAEVAGRRGRVRGGGAGRERMGSLPAEGRAG